MSEVETNAESSSTNPERPAPDAIPPGPHFVAANQPSYMQTLFLGPEGLRPGWGLVIYAALYYPLQQFAEDWAASLDLGASGLWSMMLSEFGSLLAALIPAIFIARIERRPWRVYGLPPRDAFGRLFWTGAVWGSAAISLLLFALHGLHVYAFGHVVLHGARIARFAAFWAAMFFLVGLYEEFLLRGYSQFTLTRGIGFWPSAVTLSCAFGLIHLRNSGEQWPGLLAATCIGFFFCLTLRRTGSLWFAVGFHSAWDWGETFFYSVPDSGMIGPGHLLSSSLHGPDWLSGGSVGPEGSVLCFVVIATTWIAFDRVYRKNVPADYTILPLPGSVGSSLNSSD
jgi:membrane protease YdiL (CAAX protease family)